MEPYKFNLRHPRLWVLDKIKEGDICAEIGVLNGDYASLICERPLSKLYLIDPWVSITDVPDRWHACPQEKMDNYKTEVFNKFSDNNKVEIIEKYSADTFSDFEDDYFDWVYLDANHSYSFVFEDLINWWPKLKPQGFLCGGAYIDVPFAREVLDFGVIPAVDDFRQQKSEMIESFETTESEYIIQKK
jgi:hypothetical protein